MVNPVAPATQTQPVAEVAAKPQAKAAQATPQAAATADTVQLSATAQAQAAALKELKETPAQTNKEANSGDMQARMLLAREAAAKPAAR
jgi:hypothetical protein